MAKRVFLIVADSFGVGELPDAALYGDTGSDTLRSIYQTGRLNVPVLRSLGLFNIDGVDFGRRSCIVRASFGRCAEKSVGKDTTVGHFELAGCVMDKPYPTYPSGFPDDLIKKFETAVGRGVLCNKPYSGTQAIADFGREHVKTGSLIVYTSADSVFQIAAHEDVVGLEELYSICRVAREMLTGDNGVARVIARPFAGEWPYYRTSNRHDYSLPAPKRTMLDVLKDSGRDVIGVGKIEDIFAGRGLTESYRTTSNRNGMDTLIRVGRRAFSGLCFVNLVDFDMNFGHRNDAVGYCSAVTYFDRRLGQFMQLLRKDDILIVTADHGCDPATPSTDHSREYIPLMITGSGVRNAYNLGTRSSFADIGATVLDYLGCEEKLDGNSFLSELSQNTEKIR